MIGFVVDEQKQHSVHLPASLPALHLPNSLISRLWLHNHALLFLTFELKDFEHRTHMGVML